LAALVYTKALSKKRFIHAYYRDKIAMYIFIRTLPILISIP